MPCQQKQAGCFDDFEDRVSIIKCMDLRKTENQDTKETSEVEIKVHRGLNFYFKAKKI